MFAFRYIKLFQYVKELILLLSLSKSQLQPLFWFDVAKILQVFEISKFLLLKIVEFSNFVGIEGVEPSFSDPNSDVIKTDIRNPNLFQRTLLYFVRMEGFEPPFDCYIYSPAPKAGMLTYYTTSCLFSFSLCKDTNNFWNYQIFSQKSFVLFLISQTSYPSNPSL